MKDRSKPRRKPKSKRKIKRDLLRRGNILKLKLNRWIKRDLKKKRR